MKQPNRFNDSPKSGPRSVPEKQKRTDKCNTDRRDFKLGLNIKPRTK